MSLEHDFSSAFDAYTSDFPKQHDDNHDNLDLFGFQAPSDVLVAHPDLFESELDLSLAAIDEGQLQLLTVDSNDPFYSFRSETPTRGPPSTITASSSSAYGSEYSESLYSGYQPSNFSLPLDLQMQFTRFGVTNVGSDYGAAPNVNVVAPNDTIDPHSFGTLPLTPPRSPILSAASPDSKYNRGRSFSDYAPSPASSAEYYNNLASYGAKVKQSTVAPSSTGINASSSLARRSSDVEDRDPRKKYRCTACPRSFARAYNLKTHMATHDPNRLKPHVCPHRACHRSFSRKHDLGRHLVSIHRDDSLCGSTHSASSKKSIGVDQASRGWCDSCGKGWVGREKECTCDVK